MKHTTLTSRTLLGLALMGALAVAPTMTRAAHADADADAPDVAARDARNFDRDDNDGERANDNRRGKADGRNKGGRRGGPGGRAEFGRRPDFGSRGGRAEFGGRADFDGRGGRNQNERPDFGPRGNRDNGRVGADFGNRERNRKQGDIRGGNLNARLDNRPAVAPQFVGVVSKVKSDSEFDVRIGDKTYNVYLSAPAGAVRIGQTVQLNGERIGNNDIRSASVLQERRR